MSQILDAINKAEKQRKDALEETATTRESLYASLNQVKPEKRRSRLLPLSLLAIASLGGAGYSIFKQPSPKKETTPVITSSSNKPLLNQDSKMTQGQHLAKANNNVANTATKAQNTVLKAPAVQAAPSETSNKKMPQVPAQAIKTSKGKKPPELAALTPVPTSQRPNPKLLTQLTPVKKAQAPTAIVKTTSIAKKSIAKRPNTVKPAVSHAKPVATATPQPAATPSWKKNIRITAIMYHENPSRRFVLIRGKKIYEGGVIPDSQTAVVKILPKNIIINDGSGDVMIR